MNWPEGRKMWGKIRPLVLLILFDFHQKLAYIQSVLLWPKSLDIHLINLEVDFQFKTRLRPDVFQT